MANYAGFAVAEASDLALAYLPKQVTNPDLMVSRPLPERVSYRQRARNTVDDTAVFWTEPGTRGGTSQAPVATLADIVVIDEVTT